MHWYTRQAGTLSNGRVGQAYTAVPLDFEFQWDLTSINVTNGSWTKTGHRGNNLWMHAPYGQWQNAEVLPVVKEDEGWGTDAGPHEVSDLTFNMWNVKWSQLANQVNSMFGIATTLVIGNPLCWAGLELVGVTAAMAAPPGYPTCFHGAGEFRRTSP
jgi:hypothetical protein